MPRLRFTSTVQGVSTIELNESIITVGRVANNVVCIEDPNISKHHTLLVSEDDTYKIYDLHSVNGTWVNGERVTVTKLKEGDAVRIGYLELEYEIATPVVPARPALAPPVASKTATGPTTLAARPRLGIKPGIAPVVVPAAATISEPPSATAPPPLVTEEKRIMIRVPDQKKITPPATPPPAPPVIATVETVPHPAPALGGLGKPKGFGRPPAPAPVIPAPAAETPTDAAAPAPETPPPAGPKKLGAAPGGGPGKFKLRRE